MRTGEGEGPGALPLHVPLLPHAVAHQGCTQGTPGTLGTPPTTAADVTHTLTTAPAVVSDTAWGSVPQEHARPGVRGRQGRPRWREGACICSRGTRLQMCVREGVWIALGSNDPQMALWAICSGSRTQDPDPRTLTPGS